MQHELDVRICPVFRYQDAPRAIEWLGRAFGFTVHELHKMPNGDVAHAELRYGAGAIAISSAGAADAANPWTMVRQGLYVVVPDVDAVFSRAQAAHAVIAQPPRDTDYGAREGSLRDSGGHLWSFGTYPAGVAGAEPTLFVDLHYEDGPRAITFLESAFGFTPGLKVEGPGGVIEHAELWLGHQPIMLSSTPLRAGHWNGHVQCACVWVEDVDDHHARAVSAGATILAAPHVTSYGAVAYYATDCERFVWGFSTYRPTRADARATS